MGSALYYLVLAVASLALGILNFNITSSAKNLTCYKNVTMDNNTYLQFIGSFAGNYTEPTTSILKTEVNGTTYYVKEPHSNPYSKISSIIGIIYLVLMGLSVVLALIINYMSDAVPEDFLKIGRCKKFLAMFTKIMPPLFIIAHWICMILIIVLWIMIISKNCEITISTTPGNMPDPGKYYRDNFVMNIVNSSMWIFIHYGGAIVRDIVYQEPFMYSPDIGKPSFCKSFFLKKLGP